MEPETKYAKSGDVNIAYQVVGDGPLCADASRFQPPPTGVAAPWVPDLVWAADEGPGPPEGRPYKSRLEILPEGGRDVI